MDVLLHEEKKGDINPPRRARNSRLGESQGWPLDHSLFFSLSLSLSLSLQQSPIILGNFTISNLCPAFSANDTSTSREMFKITDNPQQPFLTIDYSFNNRFTCEHALTYGISLPAIMNPGALGTL